ncbi:pyrroline-5-carboxylate reductase [Cryobacterium mesophilum]|uniref:Pyrroline-5-carboxylate reductase n=1 Tax=Terrimesophilobacter mesophilus TaxID=433647 RepID=A0A4R8VBC3_9MICO|nr:pyrroline-5-carboxylate reductase [Terrimesophilobacter mesophilus]MBB5633374.1 pyrroline-5-carboxylate reductase [Terrimesophilobacter mesophilus]TFB80103.1 pyrroline-5-carboxylate reductase [Terrimesophilobacter mesophilus]
MVTLPAVAILGAGSMGGAILSGLVAPGVSVDGGVRVTNRTESKAAAIRSDAVASFSTESDPRANLAAVTGAKIVIAAVKPPMIPDLLREVGAALDPDAMVVSVAAGVTTRTMEALLPRSVGVLRAMPNTPATVGMGVTGLSAGSRSTPEQLALATTLFETVGTVVVVPEDRIDALSAISGSGPAYVFHLIEQWTSTAVSMGFSAQDAATLVETTFRGASELLAASGSTPEELRRRVTSPNGTTERAIAVLEDADLKEIFDRAAAAALARSRELAAGGRD